MHGRNGSKMPAGFEYGGPAAPVGGAFAVVPAIAFPRLALHVQQPKLHAPGGEAMTARAVERVHDVRQMVVGRSEQRHAEVQRTVHDRVLTSTASATGSATCATPAPSGPR